MTLVEIARLAKVSIGAVSRTVQHVANSPRWSWPFVRSINVVHVQDSWTLCTASALWINVGSTSPKVPPTRSPKAKYNFLYKEYNSL